MYIYIVYVFTYIYICIYMYVYIYSRCVYAYIYILPKLTITSYYVSCWFSQNCLMNDPPMMGGLITPARVDKKKPEGLAKRPCHICGPSSSQLLSTLRGQNNTKSVSDFG